MIWPALAVFAVSFVLTALLAPKPKLENARAQELDPESFPRASENAPIPLILGKVRFDAPNTIWHGNFRSVPIVERVKVSVFKKKNVTVGHNYYIDIHLAYCLGPNVRMTKIIYDDKELWSGSTSLSAPSDIIVHSPSFLGGHKNGGGVGFTGRFYNGATSLADQPVDANLAAAVSISPPAYLGVSHMFFKDFWLGEAPGLRNLSLVLECYTNSLTLSGGGKIGEDLNPAEAIYQVFTNRWQGAGLAEDILDIPSLRAFGELCYAEGNGVSICISAGSSTKEILGEILRQTDAIGYQDPETGKIVFVPIRENYNTADLPVYDENDIIAVTNFSRSSWEELFSEVKVSYPQREKESDAVAVAQDMATITMMGRPSSTNISFPFCYDPALAGRLAAREQAHLGTPLFSMTVEMNRNGARLRPGDVVKISWPDYGFRELVMRVQSFDLGSMVDGKIVVSFIQEQFAVSNVVFNGDASAWVPQNTTPLAITTSLAIQAPYPMRLNAEFDIPREAPIFLIAAKAPSEDSTMFDVLAGSSAGDLESPDPDYVPYSAIGFLSNAYSETAGWDNGYDDSATGIDLYGVENRMFQSASESEIRNLTGGLLYVGGEWMSYITATTTGAATQRLTNIRRGLFGTRPRNHIAGTPVWGISIENMTNSAPIPTDTSTLYYVTLDRIGSRVRDLNTATILTKTNTSAEALGRKPKRPTDVRLSGSRSGLAVTTRISRPVTWREQFRDDNAVRFEGETGFKPFDSNETITYSVDVYINGSRINSLSSSGHTGNTANINFADYSGAISSSDCEVRVTANSGGYNSEYGSAKFTINLPA